MEVGYNLATATSVSNPPHLVVGTKTQEPLVDNDPQGQAEAFQMIPAKSGVVTSVQVYLDRQLNSNDTRRRYLSEQ